MRRGSEAAARGGMLARGPSAARRAEPGGGRGALWWPAARQVKQLAAIGNETFHEWAGGQLLDVDVQKSKWLRDRRPGQSSHALALIGLQLKPRPRLRLKNPRRARAHRLPPPFTRFRPPPARGAQSSTEQSAPAQPALAGRAPGRPPPREQTGREVCEAWPSFVGCYCPAIAVAIAPRPIAASVAAYALPMLTVPVTLLMKGPASWLAPAALGWRQLSWAVARARLPGRAGTFWWIMTGHSGRLSKAGVKGREKRR
ncbi:hypothetical protein B0J12DRAFT_182679 [Macrophomina phaseolina]|uniref:Uncharacterized protein n=1 Tax=Macrophomina phaseolina TaxID=35725 RepID=A0ABQ8G7I6_9PEZI|nr:hypothetical protein B0J12DRAFT_182679 [Macrophomina phaseolina]